MWQLPKEIFDLATESLNKVRLEKTQTMIAEKKEFKKLLSKWEINIKDILNKILCIWKLNVHF